METTRHDTATVYVVGDGAVALHEHEGLGKWLPPGGHVDRDELPHEAGLREVREETGLDAELVAERDDIGSATVEALPKPRHVQLADVNVHDGFVGHQHVDLVYYARADSREIDPAAGEQPADAWRWFTAEDLEATDALDPDVAEIGRRAIETVPE
ncbi:NUDIX domain-containing protein [Halosimplex rubrum]|uniref:NUDIX domain-containing protein n=1 Tax=Halosimplex rubrum TaxID=869889 RepID=A0A7D5T0H1_9EURY|nr:NUDIX domain-containing protein [Halosimplex rubrum]QLH78028.1 NUDIX domain-containing protein [Halosimplex rubrum]